VIDLHDVVGLLTLIGAQRSQRHFGFGHSRSRLGAAGSGLSCHRPDHRRASIDEPDLEVLDLRFFFEKEQLEYRETFFHRDISDLHGIVHDTRLDRRGYRFRLLAGTRGTRSAQEDGGEYQRGAKSLYVARLDAIHGVIGDWLT
jgi:hypothetical protein